MITLTKSQATTKEEILGRVIISQEFDTMILNGDTISLDKSDSEAIKNIILKYIGSVKDFVSSKEVAAISEKIEP